MQLGVQLGTICRDAALNSQDQPTRATYCDFCSWKSVSLGIRQQLCPHYIDYSDIVTIKLSALTIAKTTCPRSCTVCQLKPTSAEFNIL